MTENTKTLGYMVSAPKKPQSLKERLAMLAEAKARAHDKAVDDKCLYDKSESKPLTPPAKALSLSERLRLKAAEREALALSEDSKEELESSIQSTDPEAVVLNTDSIPEPAKLTVDEAVKTVEEAKASIPAPAVTDSAVIKVLGSFMSLEELTKEEQKLIKLTAKLKSNALLARLEAVREGLKELQAQIEHFEAQEPVPSVQTVISDAIRCAIEAKPTAPRETFSLSIVLNERQLMAKEMALTGKSFCLIGPAGTGKTTAQRSIAKALLEQGMLHSTTFKGASSTDDRKEGLSFVACAFTRRASANLARAIHKDPELEEALKNNIMTIHALLEFAPVYFFDPIKQKDSMRFEPQRTASNPLDITHLVIEESSMLGLDLYAQLYDALPEGVQIIYIGDINQLPPVFGASILNYALVQLPVVELTEVYRNGGVVLENAHRVLRGESIVEGESIDEDTGKRSSVTIIRGKQEKQVGQERMAMALAQMFELWYEEGSYDPEQDMILSPFNKQPLGTDSMNKWIAQFLGAKRQAVVYEVIAGFAKHYLAVGDKVMVNKQDGLIVQINRNATYMGAEPRLPGADLSRFGHRIAGTDSGVDPFADTVEDGEVPTLNYAEFSLDKLKEQQAERKMQASHFVDVLLESGEVLTLTGAGDFGPQSFSLGYVLTVHKAQGCEFRKVYVIMHKDHSVMLFRELLYTAMTRTVQDLILIAKDWVLDKAIKTQRIKGDDLASKLEYFNSGAVDMVGGTVSCTK